VEPGDTFYSIAENHGCALQGIHDANPSLEVERLQVSLESSSSRRGRESRARTHAHSPFQTHTHTVV
jgi:hypothetical protein